LGANPPPERMQGLKKDLPPELKGFGALLDAQNITMTVKVADDGAALEATGKYPSDDSAKKGKKALEGVKAMAGLALPQMEAGLKKTLKPQELKELMDQVNALIDGAEVGQQGAAGDLKVKGRGTLLQRAMPGLMGGG